MKIKKILALSLTGAMLLTCLAGCGDSKNGTDTGDNKAAKEVYFLNFKPEIADVYKKIAEDYKKEKGVELKVKTAASGTYEQTLKSEMAKSDAPALFQINGPIGYKSWKDYCADLKDTDLYKHLNDKSLAVTSGDGVYGIPYTVEGYGIIYNKAIIDKYCSLPDKKANIKSAEDIKDFKTLKTVVEDMQKNKDKLGIKGVFASTSLSTGNAWRWDTHLANVPLYYEFKDKAGSGSVIDAGLAAKTIDFKYGDNYKNIFDLYINNSCTEKGLLGSKTVDDSMAEFALGDCAMVQNGNWGWSQVAKVSGNTVQASDIKMLPIYTGTSNDSKQGICVGTENYFAVNSKLSKEKQQAAEDFMNWLFTSDTGRKYVVNDLGFMAPFDTFKDDEKPNDPLSQEVMRWMGDKDVKNVNWIFPAFPSEKFKTDFSGSLLEYVQGTKSWDDVTKIVKDSWAAEKK